MPQKLILPSMLQLQYRAASLPFKHPFTLSKGTKTHQETLVVSLAFAGRAAGLGEAPAIGYYNVTVAGMMEVLAKHKSSIERYALQDPERFWHFLHHLIPGENFLTAALDTAAWDLFAQLRRQSLQNLLGTAGKQSPQTDFTIGIDTPEAMAQKVKEMPWPVYKVKVGVPADIDNLRAIRAVTTAPLRVDANEGWTYEEALRLLPELEKLGVVLLEQPLKREDTEAQMALKAQSNILLFADESCVGEKDVATCAAGFHGVNIKFAKCGGLTPARRMITEARTLGLQVMLGTMNECGIGTAALAALAPLADFLDADGPLLLAGDLVTGLEMEDYRWVLSEHTGLGLRWK